VSERDLGLAVGAFAADDDFPGFDIDLGNIGEVIADEKCVIGRNRGAKIFQRSLIIRRPIGELDQGLFARQRVEDSITARALRESGGQIDASGRSSEGARNGQRQSSAPSGERATCQHGLLLPSGSFFFWLSHFLGYFIC